MVDLVEHDEVRPADAIELSGQLVEHVTGPESPLRESAGEFQKPIDEPTNPGSEHRREYRRTPRGQRLLTDAVKRAIQFEALTDDIAVRDPIPTW
ncbi:hypothetical protein PM076_17450 [Halorubrum ezzemoulense]|uniref:Uncharacterized protein n=1 Tax=Halorubrum ezzemoulense TaxID=337243 RepID=A0ABT4Z950_HALEZ|nr:hypothetical protein [Halorubrum ezzemoulense]MDB2280134.1 hypothetical protein [Halorubrum ezzemoulense]MDB2290552.1 hypothetical protein [Halorubrum ezzemoulense]MDB2294025.1 hypothetical protein [Halorubrum ezzemoulense]MDB2298024.1 hypothetical protein [Halorubrum ezzemoulense]MDB2301465.1 hypothetical protein [Halorubrum ezzemoulense]